MRQLSVLRFCLGLLLLTLASSCSSVREETRTELNLLGTTCTLTVYASDPGAVLDAAFDRIRDIDWRMRYSGDKSEVGAVNAAAGGAGVEVSPSTLAVLQRGLYFSRLSGGRFDISIGPLVELWGIGKDVEGEVPPAQEIEEALSLVDYTRVRVDGTKVSLETPGMSIDLGGIAKGYAADEVVRVFAEAGVRHALINLGGNVYAYGSKPDGSPWRIGVQSPVSGRGAYLGVLNVEDRAVVTSGPYERFFIKDGIRYHHILDTATGYPVENGISSVTIVAESSMDADALSTLVFTLGTEKGLELVEEMDAVETLIVTEDMKIHHSSGARTGFRLTDDGFTLVP
jgi:FAD:protein FMN transferase